MVRMHAFTPATRRGKGGCYQGAATKPAPTRVTGHIDRPDETQEQGPFTYPQQDMAGSSRLR